MSEHDPFKNPAAHTRVPNIVQDILIPLVEPPERECLHYIIRHTYGYADAKNGGRKERDTISLDQFENGVSSGNYLIDLGTQMSRNTIKRALASLEEKGIVDVRYSCTTCLWEPSDGEEVSSDGKERPLCPRCARTLSLSWAIAKLNWRKVQALLNQFDKQGRTWTYDIDKKRFQWEENSGQKKTKTEIEDALREEGIAIYKQLWYRKRVDAAIDMAEKQLKAGRKMTLRRRINNFYKPVLALQEKFNNPALISYALEQTLSSDALKRPDTHSWYKYMSKVCENSQGRFTGARASDTNEAVERANSPEHAEKVVRELLRTASVLNGKGEATAALTVLQSEILPMVERVAVLFSNNTKETELHLKEAFKQGSSDFLGISPNPYGLDYLSDFKQECEN